MGTSEEDVAWLIENTDWARDYEKGGWFKSERDQHPLDLPEYAIGRSPVTNREYQAFVEAAGHEPPSHWNGRTAPEEIGDHPVVNVSWRDALAYCRWLAEATGKPYQLPSEPEWEKAARGGLEIPGSDGRRMIGNPVPGRYWPWGNEFDLALCNTSEAKKGTTTPVRQYSPEGDSPYGCSDMAGNVWEWTRSLWGTEIEQPDFGYPYVPSDGREDETAGDNVRRVVRGGSWDINRRNARCAYRLRYLPYNRDNYAGFRVVLAPPT
jgi:formylglycine-generating enzyme required for sulfatase activity